MIKEARQFCEENGHRMTPPREHVLQIVAEAEKPLGAYDILQRLAAHLDNPKPPTAYRAIEFWQEHRFIHRIESLNAYVSCHAGHQHSGSQYMICDDCGKAEEIHMCHIPDALEKKAQAGGFQVKSWNTELHGQCLDCASVAN
jgi:Fur family zinc uptake transcriptional regulator